VFAVFGSSIDRLRGVLLDVSASLPDDRDCPCPNSLDGTTAG
jgi:5'-methylthioadenosine phosphorylase